MFSYFSSAVSSANLFRLLLKARCVSVIGQGHLRREKEEARLWLLHCRETERLTLARSCGSCSRCDVCIKCCGTAGEGEANSGGEERHRGGVLLSRALKDG